MEHATRMPQAPDPEVRVPRRVATSWFAAALLLLGVALSGWAAWQVWGTSYLAQQAQREVVAGVTQQWSGRGPAKIRTEDGVVGAIVRIPRFGRDYAVPVFDGTSQEALVAGFGHFSASAGPGEVGNLALAAHRITRGESLRRMPELRVGDQIMVETRLATYVYELRTDGDALRVPFTETWVVDPQPVNPRPDGTDPPSGPGRRLLTLVTCAELFSTDDRSIAFAELTETRPHDRGARSLR